MIDKDVRELEPNWTNMHGVPALRCVSLKPLGGRVSRRFFLNWHLTFYNLARLSVTPS